MACRYTAGLRHHSGPAQYQVQHCCNVPCRRTARLATLQRSPLTASSCLLVCSSLTAPSCVPVRPYVAAQSVSFYEYSPGERGGDEPREAGAHVHVLRAQHRSRTPVPRPHRHQLHQLLYQSEGHHMYHQYVPRMKCLTPAVGLVRNTGVNRLPCSL